MLMSRMGASVSAGQYDESNVGGDFVIRSHELYLLLCEGSEESRPDVSATISQTVLTVNKTVGR